MSSKNFDVSNLREKNYYSLLSVLVSYIREHHYEVGDRLPQESVLALELNTNRSTLREMLRVLEVLGVIESQRGSGNTFLGNLEVGFMNLILVSSMLTDGMPMEFSSIRSAIEAEAIESFIDNYTDTDIFRLEILLDDRLSVKDKNDPKYLEAHIEFHDSIMKYYPNQIAKQLIHSNLRLMQRDYEAKIDYDENMTEAEKEAYKQKMLNSSHEMILDAIKRRDKDLARERIINHAFMTGVHKKY